jgi:hypothetical protein
MATKVYPKYLVACLKGLGPDLSSVTVKVVAVDSADYTYSDAHEFLSDVPSVARVGTSNALGSKTFGSVGEGVFDAADTTIVGVTGDPFEDAIVYVDTGTDTTSRLLSFHDGLTFTPNGGNCDVAFNSSGILSI